MTQSDYAIYATIYHAHGLSSNGNHLDFDVFVVFYDSRSRD
jgi:hypothetical protein